jgi:hypothetical protein
MYGLDYLRSPHPASTATAIVHDSSTSPASRSVHLSGSGLLLGKRCEAEVWLDDPEVWEELLRLLVLHTRVDNDVVTWHPVDGGCDAVLVPRLQAVEDTEDLGRVTTSGRGVGEDEADRLLGVDDEDGADGEGDALAVDVGGILVVDPGTRVSLVRAQRGPTYMSYASATLRSLSPMMGNFSLLPLISSMSLIQPSWESIVFAERPMSFAPRRVNSGSSFAKAPSSVVQTGV